MGVLSEDSGFDFRERRLRGDRSLREERTVVEETPPLGFGSTDGPEVSSETGEERERFFGGATGGFTGSTGKVDSSCLEKLDAAVLLEALFPDVARDVLNGLSRAGDEEAEGKSGSQNPVASVDSRPKSKGV